MFTATDGVLLPTTVTGSWPRPRWFTQSLTGRRFSDALTNVTYREQYLDAVATVISDQEQAGLDIVTNGDYHLDESLGGMSWLRWPVERMEGVAPEEAYASSDEWSFPTGSLLGEIFGGWRYPAVVDNISRGRSWEYAKIWRTAQMKTEKPIKFGTVCGQAAASFLKIRTDKYQQDKRDLIWDVCVAINDELRELAAAGCKVIQIEDPMIHAVAASDSDKDYVEFLIDAYNREVEGLEDVEIWIHTCWGNPNMQRVLDDTSYAGSFEIYAERLRGDVWTLEMKERGYADIDLFKTYKNRTWPKKIAIGVISHRNLQVETPEEIASDIRLAMKFIDPAQLVLSTDCGFGRQGCNRAIAFHKSVSLVHGANIVRRELGLDPREARAMDPSLQIDSFAPEELQRHGWNAPSLE